MNKIFKLIINKTIYIYIYKKENKKWNVYYIFKKLEKKSVYILEGMRK
jgi:hypothetical protein